MTTSHFLRIMGQKERENVAQQVALSRRFHFILCRLYHPLTSLLRHCDTIVSISRGARYLYPASPTVLPKIQTRPEMYPKTRATGDLDRNIQKLEGISGPILAAAGRTVPPLFFGLGHHLKRGLLYLRSNQTHLAVEQKPSTS